MRGWDEVSQKKLFFITLFHMRCMDSRVCGGEGLLHRSLEV